MLKDQGLDDKPDKPARSAASQAILASFHIYMKDEVFHPPKSQEFQ